MTTETVDGIVVVGSGGHAKVVIELLRAMGETVSFCIGGPNDAETCLGVRILKGDDFLPLLRLEGFHRAIVAVGSNQIRRRLADVALQTGYELVNAISPQAILSPSMRLGTGVAIMAGAILNAECAIDDLAIINTGATIDHDCAIGRAAHIAPQCALAGTVTVGAGSFLGVGCKVIPGVHIGAEVTIGAGGVVIEDIPSGAVAVGVPAKVIKMRESIDTSVANTVASTMKAR